MLSSLDTPIVVKLDDINVNENRVKAPLGANPATLSSADRRKLEARARRRARQNKKVKDKSHPPEKDEGDIELEFMQAQED